MSEQPFNDQADGAGAENRVPDEIQQRREFLQGLGKWSGAAIVAAVGGGVWLASAGKAHAGRWVNRRVGGGAWANRAVGGGAWTNRSVGGGGAWVNRRVGGGAWVNRR